MKDCYNSDCLGDDYADIVEVARDVMLCLEVKYDAKKEVKWSDLKQHGLHLEPVERQAFVLYKHTQGKMFWMTKCGLVVSSDHPYHLTNSMVGYTAEYCTD